MHKEEDTGRIMQEVLGYKTAIAETVMKVDPEGLDPVVAVYIAADMMGSALGTLIQMGVFEDGDLAAQHAVDLIGQSINEHLSKKGTPFRN